ncbi:hypothetical protein CkaCkLH20_00427 [Colletotrichum karsti]|uniref:Uncharacterized protein n=1 Tax=Colletotrichum karsti TaxID=1095194 RepID=A0A9P6LQX9_9PEZI|nr:uncharacterized protein CkaCkLH20_00427 [Colletotrichum karsti]KAF9882391.1 hypothetical protein CkaCkLH20_00427 [Colletotrichum karsti]
MTVPLDDGPEKPQARAEPSVLDRKRPVGRFPVSFSANLGRNTSCYISKEESASGTDQTVPPLPESKSIIHRKRDVIAGIHPPLPTSRHRQASAASSVKAMVAKFEGAGETPEKIAADSMADCDHTPSSPIVDKGKGKSVDASIDTSTTVSSMAVGQASQPIQQKSLNADEDELDLLKMQEFYKTQPLARCLDDYVPPKRNDEKVDVLPIEQDEGKSMLKAAKLELHNKLVDLHETFEERHPTAKQERLQKEAVAEALKIGQSSKSAISSTASDASTKASRRADKKAQKKADKKAQKVAKRENVCDKGDDDGADITIDKSINDDDGTMTLDESREVVVSSSSQGASKPLAQSGANGESFAFIQRDPEEISDTESVKASKAAAKLKEKEDANRRAHEVVNAAHAKDEIVHLENTKPIRDQISTDIKKSDIVPGFGKNKASAPAFDEEAYAARSIACHTMKPAPLRIPSRTKQLTADDSKNDTKGSSGVVNFSRPQSRQEKEPSAQTSAQPAGKKKLSSRAELNAFFGTKDKPGPYIVYEQELLARQVRRAQAAEAAEAAEAAKVAEAAKAAQSAKAPERLSFTADDYQSLIQDDYDQLVKDSPVKNKKPVAQTTTNLALAPGDTSKIVSQTVNFNGQFPQPQPLAGTRSYGHSGPAFPPTPASNHRPKTTDDKWEELDDFFAEENDDLYQAPGSAVTPTLSGPQQQPWDDPAYHEEALAYGYAHLQRNHHPLPDGVDPVPLTHDQRRKVLAAYGMTESEYPAPPAGYPVPAGTDGVAAPPCPTRPAPTVPGARTSTSTAGTGGGSTGQVQSLRRAPRRFQRAATAPPAPESPAPGYDADWF